MSKPKVMLTVDVEALTMRAESDHVNTLIYGRKDGKEYGIGKMMDIADKYGIKMTFFVDFAECELYGDDILEVGRYIDARGHDLQVHCHYDILEKIVKKAPWQSHQNNYYSWYNNNEDSQIMIDYVTDKYVKCTGRMPLAYRGGEYRFGISILEMLKNKGYLADLTYNCLRPQILSVNKQFKYENNLIEFPVGISPVKKPLNLNYASLTPKSKDEYHSIVNEYKELLCDYYDYFGQDTILSFMMHSWSFMHNSERFASSGYFDTPNDITLDFFDYFVREMKETIDFISVSQALEQIEPEQLKTVDFNSVFHRNPHISEYNLTKISDYIVKKANGRNIIIWGRGWLESTVFYNKNLNETVDIAYYISNDADIKPVWRGKPVHKFSDTTLDPKKDYIFVLAQSTYSEIRDTLRELGFKEYEDFYDIQKKLPTVTENGIKAEIDMTCPICGGNIFETYNSNELRRCSECASIERTRTAAKLINENVNLDFTNSRLLHVSPGKAEREIFRKLGAKSDTVDIRPECNTDIVADICNMPEISSETYDVVFANCVLNHVYDDEKALSEINRVLRNGGTALLYVMGSGILKTTIPEDPTGWYGKENFEKYKVGTFRRYGEVDFTAQLNRYFSIVRCFEKYDEITDSSCIWYVCQK